MDTLWSDFLLEDNAILDYLYNLDLSTEYSGNLVIELRDYITYAKVIPIEIGWKKGDHPVEAPYMRRISLVYILRIGVKVQ